MKFKVTNDAIYLNGKLWKTIKFISDDKMEFVGVRKIKDILND